jgi:hypothetical protein
MELTRRGSASEDEICQGVILFKLTSKQSSKWPRQSTTTMVKATKYPGRTPYDLYYKEL